MVYKDRFGCALVKYEGSKISEMKDTCGSGTGDDDTRIENTFANSDVRIL